MHFVGNKECIALIAEAVARPKVRLGPAHHVNRAVRIGTDVDVNHEIKTVTGVDAVKEAPKLDTSRSPPPSSFSRRARRAETRSRARQVRARRRADHRGPQRKQAVDVAESLLLGVRGPRLRATVFFSFSFSVARARRGIFGSATAAKKKKGHKKKKKKKSAGFVITS